MTDINEEIKKLNNKELEEKIINLNHNQLSIIKRASYLNAVYSINRVENHLDDEEKFKRDNYNAEAKELDEYIEEIKLLIRDLDKNKVLEIREKLFKKKNIIDGYLVEISYLSDLVDEYGISLLSNTKEFKHFHKESVDEIITIIHQELDETQGNYNKYMFIISEIINILPMRLVKQNYYDILSSTIKRNFINRNKTYVETKVDSYKKNFDSSTRDGYGIEFDYYFMEIHRIRREKLKEKTIEELSVYVSRIVELTEELNVLKELIQTCGNILNMLIVVDLLREIEVDIDEFIDEWEEVSLLKDKKEISSFNRSIELELEKNEKELQKDVPYYEGLTIEVSKREGFNQDILDKELVKTREVLSYYNDLGFSSIEFLQSFDMEAVEESYIENSINSLFDYMNRSMDNIKNKERKIRMRNLMSIIELPFDNIKEFTDYIRYSLDSRVVDVRIINFKINQIKYFLNEIKDK